MDRLIFALLALFLLAFPANAQTGCGTLSGCPPASTPLSGSELLYMVQNGVSKQITSSNFIGQNILPLNNIWPGTNTFLAGDIFGAADIRKFGCVADGVTDQTACFNTALSTYSGCIVIPPTTLGFYIAGTATVTRCLSGTVFNPSVGGGSFAGTSWIKCNNQSAHTCLRVNTGGSGQSAEVHDLSLVGSGATPVAGAIAFQWTAGYNIILTNFQSVNFDTCAYFGPTDESGLGPISAHMTNTFFSKCQKHYVVDDGIPELYFIGGRWGENGGHDYDSADDFIYATMTALSGAGGGPNTIVIDSMQFNPGGRTVGCLLRWGGFAYSVGGFDANKVINSHFEIASGSQYTGSASRGLICIDNTVPHLPGLVITSTDLLEDGTKSIPTFNISTSVPFDNEFSFVGSTLCSASSTLTLQNMTGQHPVTFTSSYICAGQTFAAGDTTANMQIADTQLGVFTLTGAWGHLSLNNAQGNLTDNATGGVFEANDVRRSWTPTLTLGGTPVAGYSSYGNITRTPDGGYSASYNIFVSSKGAGTGGLVIGGIPYTCRAVAGANQPTGVVNFTGLTGSLSVQTATNNTIAYVVQSTSTGTVAITDSNVTNTTTLQGTITCGQTL